MALRAGAAAVVEAVTAWRAGAGGRVVVAIDGHGGSGKTTLASEAAGGLGARLVHTDDFFRDLGPPDHGSGARLPIARYYDWAALRERAIEPALAAAGAEPLMIEGVGSASPALADLVTRSVLVVTPEPVRLVRLHQRVSDAEWDEEWLAEERRYFRQRPAASFDLVVAGVD